MAAVKLKPINEQVVAVFGASSGIGRETARRFAQRGAKVVVAARGQDGLTSLVEEIRSADGEAMAITADATDFTQVKRVADRAVEIYGRLDTWVHAASVLEIGLFEKMKPRDFKRIVEINLVGQAYGAMAALPHLRENGGALIHISSVEAKRAFPLHSAYAASKHGVHGLVEALRLELTHEGVPVSVTEIMPAAINTPIFDNAKSLLGVKPQIPPPLYQPETVANLILYAAEHPTRDLIGGGSGAVMLLTQRLSPRLMDALLLLLGFKLQRSKEPESEDGPHNLFSPDGIADTVEGPFPLAARRSLYNWIETHPAATRSIAGVLAMGLAAAAATRARTAR